jgi:hypothetical protein
MSDPLAYHLTFHTYGTWLQGNSKGYVKAPHNKTGESLLTELPNISARYLAEPPFIMSQPMRVVIQHTMQEVCSHRKWGLFAVHVRTNHVHAVISAVEKPEKILNALKSYGTRRLREAGLVSMEQ